jgi:hypothetical protein
MMASWSPLWDLVIVAVVGLAAWLSYLAVRGEEARRELVRRAKDPAHWPTTKRWDGDRR